MSKFGSPIHAAVLNAICIANDRYLKSVLQRNAIERQTVITLQFQRHMASIADYCLTAYGGAGSLTTLFIRQLHKMLFPAGYTYSYEADDKLFTLVPGEYRATQGATDSTLQPGAVVLFAQPADVPIAMEAAVARVNAALPAALSPKAKREAVLQFIFDLSVIHPFGDANGRVMGMLCDLLLIKEGLPPFHIDAIKDQHRLALYEAAELAQRAQDLAPLLEVIERYNSGAFRVCGAPSLQP